LTPNTDMGEYFYQKCKWSIYESNDPDC
jgi:hypothetical protein